MKIRMHFCIQFCLALLLCGCESSNTVRLYESNSGSYVTIGKRESFEVILNGNPSTGYEWSVYTIDSSVMRQVSDPSFDSSGEVGSSGTYTFYFETVDSGVGTLTLVYSRSWESYTTPLSVFRITVNVP